MHVERAYISGGAVAPDCTPADCAPARLTALVPACAVARLVPLTPSHASGLVGEMSDCTSARNPQQLPSSDIAAGQRVGRHDLLNNHAGIS